MRLAFLCRTPEARLPDTAEFLRALLAAGTNVIAESNRIVRCLAPNVLLFVVEPSIADWKRSSGPCLRRADALVTPSHDPAVSAGAAARGRQPDVRPVFRMDGQRRVRELDGWLDQRLAAPRYEW